MNNREGKGRRFLISVERKESKVTLSDDYGARTRFGGKGEGGGGNPVRKRKREKENPCHSA